MSDGSDLYDQQVVNFLELIWGKGYLSPGGPKEISKLLSGLDLSGKKVLDIGCGAGGITISLVRDYNAKMVVGIDVESPVCNLACDRVKQAGLVDRIEIVQVEPGPLSFSQQEFDVVFSKDSIIHIPNKESLAVEVFRVLKSGGWFVASDWLISHDGEPSAQMKKYIDLEGLAFAMASPVRYKQALVQAGFKDISLLNRNPWYFAKAKLELEEFVGLNRPKLESAVGKTLIKENINTWTEMIKVLETGEHCPHHLRGQKP